MLACFNPETSVLSILWLFRVKTIANCTWFVNENWLLRYSYHFSALHFLGRSFLQFLFVCFTFLGFRSHFVNLETLRFTLYIDRALKFVHLFLSQWDTSDAEVKFLFVQNQSSNVLPFKPGLGQCINMYATPAARNVFVAHFYLPGPFPFIFSKTSPNFFLCWLWSTKVPVWTRRIK